MSSSQSEPPQPPESKDSSAASDETIRVTGGTAAVQPPGDETVSIPGGTAAVHPSAPNAAGEALLNRIAVSKRYSIDREVARGGMGAILRVLDLDIKREVAMKVMLGDADPINQIRFVEEARITGRLEHPNIVPVHELGLDAEGRHYFTMKLVKGRTLAELLEDIREKSAGARSLNQLLNTFVSAAHAVAFAHSRGVIHRDLKPANIMIGDFGEVLVMDWGLAKVKTPGPAAPPAPQTSAPIPGSSQADIPTRIHSNLNLTDTNQTLQGSIIGTPAYMSPEQAKGDIAHVDERSDVYSLGAVLYEILTLKPPVEGKNVASLLAAAAVGNIALPEYRSPERKDKIPPELGAIAMKALATDRAKRYASVDALIADIHLYMEGRAVSAKEDTAWEALVKLLNRNRAVSAVGTAAAATLLIFGIISYRVNSRARAKAEQQREIAEKRFGELQEEQQRRRAEQKNAAPAFLGRAQNSIQNRDFTAALQDVDVALNFDPELASAHMLKAQLHIVKDDLPGALAELDTCLKLKPDDTNAYELKQLCGQAQARITTTLASALADVFIRQQAFVFAESMHLSSDKQFEVFRQKIEQAWPGSGAKVLKDHDGHCVVDLNHAKQIVDLTPLEGLPVNRLMMQETGVRDLSPVTGMPLTHLLIEGTAISDLAPVRGMKLEVLNATNLRDIRDIAPLEGMPIRSLNLTGCKGVRDISVLAEMPLTDVRLTQTHVRDISPLTGLELRNLYLSFTNVTDLSPLQNMPLEGLWLGKTNIMDLSVLRGMQLKTLWLFDCDKISELAVLQGMPLEDLAINGTKVSDLTPLKDMKLKAFSFTPKNITTGLELIRAMSSLREIGINHEQRLEASEFWKRYDAGEFK